MAPLSRRAVRATVTAKCERRLPAIRSVRPRALPWCPTMPQPSGRVRIFLDTAAFESVPVQDPSPLDRNQPRTDELGTNIFS